jgi:hypothetical protein
MALALRESSDDTKAAIPFEPEHFESLPVLPVWWMGVGGMLFLVDSLIHFCKQQDAICFVVAFNAGPISSFDFDACSVPVAIVVQRLFDDCFDSCDC